MRKYIVLVVLFTVFCSCQHPINSKSEFEYPMQVGNSWDYSREFIFTVTSGDPGIIDSLPEIISSSVNVVVDRTEIINGNLYTFVVKTSENTNYPYFSEDFYIHNNDGLFIAAYRNAGAAPIAFPKQSQKVFLKFRGKTYSTMGQLYRDYNIDQNSFLKVTDDSLIFEDEAAQTLKYPLQVGSQWTYRKSNPWPMTKRIESTETCITPAGAFNCYKIKWLYDWDRNAIWDDDIYVIDYVAEEGLIQRQIFVIGSIMTDTEGNERGTFDSEERMTLINYRI